ncbi:apolipoprotein N-acyltransferase [Mycolicibacterium arenosum]|uniref:Apolipoprotein N-acyltransferase n=1 Tax=Mycolicibacterium arenosum TaxID=2952157 RepID=A0ABT1MA73_9MYCO|nr:apolipoprotein N-acyltransferase [Mycolicibacterium sp. CAU 1645]MCP9276028.1 apolipoprotein N-acyltransferase [Mycolicibacterium sp. CAU 1645]
MADPTTKLPSLKDAVLASAGRILVPRLLRLSAVIAGGLLACLSFPPFGWWYLMFPAMGLLAWALTREDTTRAGGFGYGLLFGLAFYVPLLPWISGLVGAIPWLALALVEALFPALFGYLAVVVRQLPGWPVWFAALWVLTEWLKSVVPFGGFPWGVIAFSQTNGPLLALAQWGSAPLVSFATVAVGFSLAALAIEAARRWRSDSHVSPDGPVVVLIPGLCIVLVLLSVAVASPHLRKSGAGAGEDPPVTVAAVQGNVPRLGLEFNAQRRAVLDNHVRETKRLASDVRAGRAPQPAFVVWPENSSDIDPIANADAAEQISSAAEAIRAPILVGAVVAAPGYSRDTPAATNTAIVWDPVEGPGERHDKKIVQPFGEYLPWRPFFKLLSSYADRAGYFVPGDGDGVVHANGMTVGVTTCWEVIFDRAARESVLNGAQFLTVPANNATFDAAMSAQQLAFGKLRAVEHDRYVVVAGTVGISAVVAPDGRELGRTGFFESGYLDTQIRLKSDLTPATRWGPLVQGLLVMIGVAAVVTAMLHNGLFSRRRKSAADVALDDEGAP